MEDKNREIKTHKLGIDNVIAKAESVELSGKDLMDILNDNVKIITYEELEGIDSIDSILDPFGAVIILYQMKSNVGHWVLLFKTSPQKLEFFDPYGLDVDQELDIINEYHTRIHGGQIVPHLTALLENSPYSVVANKIQLQNFIADVETCGRWCAIRLKFRNIPLSRFVQLFTFNEHYDGDWFVSALTYLYSV